MEFCDKCGSRMIQTAEGMRCRRCGNEVCVKPLMQVKDDKRFKQHDSVFVFGNEDDSARVVQECPKCGNREAFHWFSGISGEHAGIARERTVEHFKCTKCSNSWIKTH